jgi:hypothetical protein
MSSTAPRTRPVRDAGTQRRPPAVRPDGTDPAAHPSRPDHPGGLGAAPVLALVAAAALMLIAVANNEAREGAADADLLFWAGLSLIFFPIALRLFSRRPARAERLALVVLLGLALYLVKILHSPVGFTLHDELATWREVSDVLSSGRLLSENPLVPGYGGYPGIEAVAAAIHDLTGLPIFESGLILIGVARVGLMVALFLFFERVARSAWAAGIAVAIYACNPNFLYFDSQFAYESLALVLAATLLLAVLRWTQLKGRGPISTGLLGAIGVVASGLAVTHHMTSFALLGFLLIWAAVVIGLDTRGQGPSREGLARLIRRGRLQDSPAIPTLVIAVPVLAWFLLFSVGSTVEELGGVFTGAIHSVGDLLTFGSEPKGLFKSEAGPVDSTLARAVGLASVAVLVVMLPIGLWVTWRLRRTSPISLALALVAAVYPFALALRLTDEGSEISQRASEFLFVGLAFVVSILFVAMASRRSARLRALARPSLAAALATVVFAGGVIVGESPATRQPGPFLVGAESRSLGPESYAAAEFAATHLPENSRLLADRTNGMLMGSYGKQDLVFGSVGDVSVMRIFFSDTFDGVDQMLLTEKEVDYIVVDRRLGKSLPVTPYYFERSEPGAFEHTRPLTQEALTKFEFASGFSKVYDNGPIEIYDASARREE